jgi:hypothetical protein
MPQEARERAFDVDSRGRASTNPRMGADAAAEHQETRPHLHNLHREHLLAYKTYITLIGYVGLPITPI